MSLAHIKACIWDIDHTLYHSAPPFVPGLVNAVIETLRAHGAPEGELAEPAFSALLHEQMKLNGSAYPYLEQRYGINKSALANAADAVTTDNLVIDVRLRGLFAAHPVINVVNTHASHAWRERVLKHIGIAEHFMAFIHHIDHDFQVKSLSPATHLAALAATGCAVHDVVMIDDTAKNLRIPREMGMKTILIDYGQPEEERRMADYVVKDAASVFGLLASKN